MTPFKVEHIGFSGSRGGMTPQQARGVTTYLDLKRFQGNSEAWLHHGLCIGADYEAHVIAKSMGYKIYGHPPLDITYLAKFDRSEFDGMDPAYSYHGRNHRIVLACTSVIATPAKPYPQRGGTWNTIGWARTLKRDLVIVHADGSVVHEEHT